MTSFVVVELAERVELALQLDEIASEGLAAQPLLQRLLEPLDLARCLGMIRALRDQPGTAGSDARDLLSFAHGVGAAGEEDAEPVVVQVPEPST